MDSETYYHVLFFTHHEIERWMNTGKEKFMNLIMVHCFHATNLLKNCNRKQKRILLTIIVFAGDDYLKNQCIAYDKRTLTGCTTLSGSSWFLHFLLIDPDH